METVYAAAIIAFLIFLASFISIEIALSVAIIEITAGILASNFLSIAPAPWMDFLASFGGVLLTFLAGTEVDPALLRKKLKESAVIGGLSFLLPYVAAIACCFWFARWTWNASLIAGCALSTTSLAVVYAVLVETGLTRTVMGKVIMASTFVTDLGTVLALSLTFSAWGWPTFWFFLGSAVLIVAAARLLPRVFSRYRERVIEPEIKLLFFLLFVFMALARWGGGHAVLPVFILGLALSGMFRRDQGLLRKLRIVAFAMITPFFFIRGGMNISLAEVAANWPLLLVLLGVKTGAKFIGVLPAAIRYLKPNAMYATLLMSTGLTFGTISAYYGLQEGYITATQFSVLVAVVVLTAIVPTFIAQRWFSPQLSKGMQDELSAQEEESA